jgi:uncharacterized protein YndB with AHSA1/START domain
VSATPRVPGDEVKVSVLVAVKPAAAFRAFTEEIDQWWGRGPRYRRVGAGRNIIHFEPRVGGRLLESFTTPAGTTVTETGRVTAWEPPARLSFEFRAANFAPSEKTEVEVTFEASPSGTLVTVRHRGWARIRPDHPVRHGEETAAFLRTMGLWWGDLMTSMRVHVARTADGAGGA